MNVRELLGQSPSSRQLAIYLSILSSHVSSSHVATPEIKSYPDAVYFNYYSLGLSLLFIPINGYRPPPAASRQDLQDTLLVLDGIDIYSDLCIDKSNTKIASRSPAYSPYPIAPIVLSIFPETKERTPRPSDLSVTRDMTGKEFVAVLGEPDRKGGGSGPSSGSIGIWVEWTRDGLMVEFGGDDSRGPQAWEKGKDAPWRVISVFSYKGNQATVQCE
jgi:hypothetical protein